MSADTEPKPPRHDRTAVITLRIDLGDKADVSALRFITDLVSRLKEADVAIEQIEFEDVVVDEDDD